MVEESYQPQWATLTQEACDAREILNELLDQQYSSDQQLNESDRLRLEADRQRSIVAQQENYVGRLESALWRAEEELRLLQKRYRSLTDPVGRGRRRTTSSSSIEKVNAEVDFLLWCADQDQAEAMEREALSLPPPPAWANVVCGKEGLTIKQAVAQALRNINAVDDQGAPRSPTALQRLVDAKLDAAVKAYSRR